MRIEQKYAINLERFLQGVPKGGKFRVVTPRSTVTDARLAQISCPSSPSQGDTFLPSILGRVSRVNAEGEWRVLRDQPKEPRYIRTVRWKWTQWVGRGETEEHEDDCDIYRDCYPRDFIEPQAAELTILRNGDDFVLASEVLANTGASHERAKHVINLLLELFGRCEIVATDLKHYRPATERRVNWQMLPPGEYPWDVLHGHLTKMLKGRAESTTTVIFERQANMKTYEPDEIWTGLGGFSDYVAYVFKARKIVVLESVRRDNAIYVFGRDWQTVAQLTKAQVLSGKLHKERIVHSKGWKTRLAKFLSVAKSA
mgnify:CR=1 FL=1